MTNPKTGPVRDEPLDLQGIANHLGLKIETLRTYKKDGRLPAADGQIGGRDWWYTSTVDRWQANRPGRGHRRQTKDPSEG